jgi:hypothetical protein
MKLKTNSLASLACILIFLIIFFSIIFISVFYIIKKEGYIETNLFGIFFSLIMILYSIIEVIGRKIEIKDNILYYYSYFIFCKKIDLNLVCNYEIFEGVDISKKRSALTLVIIFNEYSKDLNILLFNKNDMKKLYNLLDEIIQNNILNIDGTAHNSQ